MNQGMMRRGTLLLQLLLLTVLAACDSGERQRLQLEELERMNRADSLMLNDSLARELVDWFDRHGTPNEQLRAYYMLGRTYADRGETPQALEAYNDAAEKADTTAIDCDFAKLSRVHAQKAELFYYQLLPDNMIREERQAMRYAKMAKDTMTYIYCYGMLAEGYDAKGEPDSALIILNEAYNMYHAIEAPSYAASLCCSMADIYVGKKDFKKAAKHISEFESLSGMFDEYGNIVSGKEMYYYIKGKLFLYTNKADSADSYFRKLLSISNSYDNKSAAYDGLQELYELYYNKDSLIKYAVLSDSLSRMGHNEIEMQKILMMQTMYNYSRNERIAFNKTMEANRFKNLFITISAISLLLFLITVILYNHYQNEKKLVLSKYQNEMEKLAQAQADILFLRAEQNISEKLLRQKEEEVKYLQKNVDTYRNKIHFLDNLAADKRLQDDPLTQRFKQYLKENPYKIPNHEDWAQLRILINQELPTFYNTLNGEGHSLNAFEYDVCMLIRIQMTPSEISKFKQCVPSYITQIRKNIYKKIFQKEGLAEDLDTYLMSIS